MRIIYFFLICILSVSFLLSGCVQERKKPEGLINPKEMADLLIEIHMIEASVVKAVLSTDSAFILTKYQEAALFQKYNISEEQFKESYNYYLKEKQDLKTIYKVVLDTLTSKNEQAKIDLQKHNQDDADRKTNVRTEDSWRLANKKWLDSNGIKKGVSDSIDQWFVEFNDSLFNLSISKTEEIFSEEELTAEEQIMINQKILKNKDSLEKLKQDNLKEKKKNIQSEEDPRFKDF